MHRPQAQLLHAAAIVGAVIALGATSSALSAPAAQAHAVLLRTTPARGATLPTGPSEVTLTFDEPPLQLGATVRVTGPGGVVSSGSPRIEKATVHQALASKLPPGSYRVDWKVTSDDGHPVSDTFSFTLSPASATAGASSSSAPTRPAPSATTASSTTSASPSSILPWGLGALAVVALATVGFAASRRERGVKP